MLELGISSIGLIVLSRRIVPQIRAALESKSAKTRMSTTLRAAVRRQNIQEAIAALRLTPEIAAEPAPRDTTACADLCARIEKIRVRSVAECSRRTPKDKTAPAKGRTTTQWPQLRLATRTQAEGHV
jgi:hypothetical protein